ncbi:ABC transporter ATP-binding protein [soil metagenome]
MTAEPIQQGPILKVPILKVDGIDVFYGASQILFGVSLDIERGQAVALLGRNGAGKSTTMKAIIGLAQPRRGRIALNGTPMPARPDRIARAGVGFVPEDRQIFPEHSVQDNLLIGAKPGAGGRTDWTIEKIYEVFPILASMRSRMGGRLSGGEQQMLTIARTLMGNPDVLLLDEPSEGLAPIIVEKIGELIQQLCAMGITLLIAEQNMHFCLDIASHVAVIDKGHIVYRDSIDGLKANDEVKRRYLAV